MSNEFDWHAEQASVVVQSQDAIAVYTNPQGNIVIRRERSWQEDEDVFIVINRNSVRSVIDALERVLQDEPEENTEAH